jgi:hypothetical protein
VGVSTTCTGFSSLPLSLTYTHMRAQKRIRIPTGNEMDPIYARYLIVW